MNELDLSSLQEKLALVDLRRWPPRVALSDFHRDSWSGTRPLKLTICQDHGHTLPCFELHYGAQEHAARYAVTTGDRLDGNLDRKYDRAVRLWATRNRDHLMTIWTALQSERNGHSFIATRPTRTEWSARRVLRAQRGRAGD